MTAPRCAFVTGAGSGIGAATARCLIANGWQVAGGHPVVVDVADEVAVVQAMEQAHHMLGGLDALATCAAIYDMTPFST